MRRESRYRKPVTLSPKRKHDKVQSSGLCRHTIRDRSLGGGKESIQSQALFSLYQGSSVATRDRQDNVHKRNNKGANKEARGLGGKEDASTRVVISLIPIQARAICAVSEVDGGGRHMVQFFTSVYKSARLARVHPTRDPPRQDYRWQPNGATLQGKVMIRQCEGALDDVAFASPPQMTFSSTR